MGYLDSFKNATKNVLTIFTACIGIGFLIYFYSANTLSDTMSESLTEMANLGAKIVENDIRRHLQILETISKTGFINDPNLSFQEKAKYLNTIFNKEDFIRITLADLQGNAWTSDGNALNIGDREHFKQAVLGKKVVSNPIVSRVEEQIVVVFAIPIYNNGQVSGILSAVYNGEELSKITDGIRLEEQGNSFIINDLGEVIAHDDRNLVYQKFNPIEEAKRDPSLKNFARLVTMMIQEKSGTGSYHYQGLKKYLGYAPIAGTDWSLVVAAPKSRIFKSVNQLLIFLMGSLLTIYFIILALNLHLEFLRKKLQKERRKSSNVIEIAEIIIVKYEQSGNILNFNRFAEIKTGFKKEEVTGKKKISDIFIAEDEEQTAILLENLAQCRCPSDIEVAIRTKMGGKIYFIGHCNALEHNPSGDGIYELTGIDITERVEAERKLRESHEQLAAFNEELTASDEELHHNLEELLESQRQFRESEERYSLVVEAAGIGIWDWDAQTKRRFASVEWCKILGIIPNATMDYFKEFRKRIHPEDWEYIKKNWKGYLENKAGHYECEHRIVLPSGEIRWVQALVKAVWNIDGKVARMAGSHLDVTRLKKYRDKLEYLAYHDPLTDLPNRLMLRFYWAKILKNRKTLKSALFFIDSDNFKFINDTLGHTLGDKIIMAVGSRIREAIGRNHTVFRIGGDEFVVSVPDFTEIKEVEEIAQIILHSFTEPFEIENSRIPITVSLGIAIYPDHGIETDELLKNADIAMYKAKELGKNRYVIYDKSIHAPIKERMRLEKYLSGALARKEFSLYYQPQVDLATGAITGFEALLRWNSPELGMVSPLKFIKITEDNGMIIPLGDWVLESACRFIKDLQVRIGRKLTVSVNASIIQLMQDNFVDKVLAVLMACQLDPESLELEITESILIESFDTIYQKLELLRKHQVGIALDDFGKGYSSLNYLCHLPISTLKIDKSFIDNVVNIDKDRIITGDIVAIGHKVGLSVIAEGVETQEQLKYLADHECDKVQGYIYSKPLPEKEVILLLRSKAQGPEI